MVQRFIGTKLLLFSNQLNICMFRYPEINCLMLSTLSLEADWYVNGICDKKDSRWGLV